MIIADLITPANFQWISILNGTFSDEFKQCPIKNREHNSFKREKKNIKIQNSWNRIGCQVSAGLFNSVPHIQQITRFN